MGLSFGKELLTSQLCFGSQTNGWKITRQQKPKGVQGVIDPAGCMAPRRSANGHPWAGPQSPQLTAGPWVACKSARQRVRTGVCRGDVE
jgi:hypothetical protein